MRATLKDGSQIAIRPISPEDRGLLERGFDRLSPESRYRRFFGPVTGLRPRDLDYLTQIDHHDHEALLALDAATGEGVGVARYVRTAEGVAEPAVVVIDDWQGRGVAGTLLDALVERAREEGIVRFQAPVLASNREAMAVLERVGRTSKRSEGREMILTIDLPPAPARLTWTELLRGFAVEALQPSRTLLQLIWHRRPGSPEDVRENIIVVGVGEADAESDVVRAATELAKAWTATVHLVAAHRFLAGQDEELRDAVRSAAVALRDEGVEVEEIVRRGDPSLVLSDAAEERNARLIVVGAGERRPSARRLLGGVADLVAERAPCSVLIVRRRSGREGTGD